MKNLKICNSELLLNMQNECDDIDVKNLKLKFDFHNYFINEKKKTVTCVINCSLYDANLGYLNSLLDFTSTATTTCLPEDEFSEKTGMQVARALAERQAYRRVVSEIKNAVKVVNQLGEKLETMQDKFQGYVEHQNDYLKMF